MFKELKKWREERGLQKTVGNIAGNLSEELTELLRAENIDEQIDALADMIVFSVNAIEAKGYNAELVLLETCKEINSREGAYNPDSEKWEKFKTQEAKAKWYKADYESCKSE